ncbi:MAG: hypothetical protein WBG86_01420 [Polyangiales bacterium]
MRFARGVFYFEVVTNLLSSGYAMLFPAAFLAQFSDEPLPVAAIEFGRWYAVLLVVLSLVLWSALRDGTDRFLRPVIGAYLFGDVLQIGVAVRLGMSLGFFSVGVHAAIWTSVGYAAVRIVYLRMTSGR